MQKLKYQRASSKNTKSFSIIKDRERKSRVRISEKVEAVD